MEKKEQNSIIEQQIEEIPEDSIPAILIDETFNQLKNEIIQKQKASLRKFYCKVCGSSFISNTNLSLCSHCDLPTCKKCLSCGFCLNCFLHMNEDSRKTLKFTQALAIAIPFLTFFLVFQGIYYFIAVEVVLVGIFFGIHYYSRRYIHKAAKRCFEPNWETEIQKLEYQQLKNPESPRRYISNDLIAAEKKKVEIRTQKLMEWVKVAENRFNEQINNKNDEKTEQINPIIIEMTGNNAKIYKLIQKPCPICGETIEFADFCPKCNLRFCPECSIENSPFNSKCVCGYEFTPLESEIVATNKMNLSNTQ